MPCYNRAYDLARVLQAYDQQRTQEPFELIAVDDGSSDETCQMLASYKSMHYTLHVEQFQTNQGPAAARNRGIQLATSPLILFVGDDILPDPYLVHGHLAAHRRYPGNQVAVLGRIQWAADLPQNTLMTHIDGMGAEQFSYYYFQDGQEYDYRHLYTANISLKTEFVRSLPKWFDTDFPFAAFEDVELSYRLARRGLQIIYCEPLLGYHYHYHNVWTFSTRQYHAGLMACLLAKKHPRTSRLVMGKGWRLHKLRWRMLAASRSNPIPDVDPLENELLHWLSEHEWQPVPNLDDIYLKVLNYYFYKGLIYGSFGDTQVGKRIHAQYALKVLAPLKDRLCQ